MFRQWPMPALSPGMAWALEQAVAEAVDRHVARAAAGIDQAALDEAAIQGFANGAFEDLDEDVPAVVEEFYPTGHGEVAQAPANGSLKDRLEAQASRLAS